MKSRGALIVFEGLDRSGKSTQAKLLFEALTSEKFNLNSELWKYPNRTTNIGTLINEYLTNQRELNDHAIHLLFSANRWETVDEMKKKLYSGHNLIVDRYAYSGTAYTAAKSGMNFEWCKQCDNGLPKPDIVFFLDTSTNVTRNRSDFGAERYERSEFQEIVYKNFKKFFTSTGDQGVLTPIDLNQTESVNSSASNKKIEISTSNNNFYVVDASQTIEKIHENILDETLKVVEKCKSQELSSLW